MLSAIDFSRDIETSPLGHFDGRCAAGQPLDGTTVPMFEAYAADDGYWTGWPGALRPHSFSSRSGSRAAAVSSAASTYFQKRAFPFGFRAGGRASQRAC